MAWNDMMDMYLHFTQKGSYNNVVTHANAIIREKGYSFCLKKRINTKNKCLSKQNVGESVYFF